MITNLGKRFFVPTLIAIAVGVAVMLTAVTFNAKAAQEELRRRLQRETLLAARLIDSWLQAQLIDLTLWSRQESVVRALEEGDTPEENLRAAHRFLDTQRAGHPFYEASFLTDARGLVIAFAADQAQPLADLEIGDRAYVRQTLEGSQVVSPVLVSRLSGKRSFAITAPVTAGGRTIGLVGGMVDLATLKSLFINDFKLIPNGFALLADSSGQVIASSRDNEQTLSRFGNFAQRITGGGEGVFSQPIDNTETLTAFRRLHHADWSLAVNQPLDASLRPFLRAGQISIVASLVVLAGLSLVSLALFRRLITRRIRAMLPVIAQVKEGDLNSRIALDDAQEDEVSLVIASFNEMIGQLQTNIAALNKEIRLRSDSEQMLAYHQEHLEQLVAERSRELESAIIERKQMEERLARVEKLELIGTLAGGVAHDLNNILSGIITYPDLLLLKLPDDSPLVKPLRSIKLSGEKAAATIQDLLILARRGIATKQPVSLNAVVEEYLRGQEYQQLCKRRPGLELRVDLGPDLSPILGSPLHLAKTVANLVNNAAESMPQAGIIHLATANRPIEAPLALYEQIEPGRYVVLEVHDQGAALAPHDLTRIFEPFHTSKKMGRGGTGLGMAVVWGTVKDHDGFVDCESRADTGNRFSLFFPVTDAMPRHEPRQPVATIESPGPHERVLIVDDSAEQRELVLVTLKELGYTAVAAASGEQGMELLKQDRFDLVLLDMILGQGMDGLDTYRQILAHAPEQKVLIVSGYAENQRIAEALRLGARGYVKKPYTVVELAQAMRRALAHP